MSHIIANQAALQLASRLSVPLRQVGAYSSGGAAFAAVNGSYRNAEAALGGSCYHVVEHSEIADSTAATMMGGYYAHQLGFQAATRIPVAHIFGSPEIVGSLLLHVDMDTVIRMSSPLLPKGFEWINDPTELASLNVLEMLVSGIVGMLSKERLPIVFDPLGFGRAEFKHYEAEDLSGAILRGIESAFAKQMPYGVYPPVVVLFPRSDEVAFKGFEKAMQAQRNS